LGGPNALWPSQLEYWVGHGPPGPPFFRPPWYKTCFVTNIAAQTVSVFVTGQGIITPGGIFTAGQNPLSFFFTSDNYSTLKIPDCKLNNYFTKLVNTVGRVIIGSHILHVVQRVFMMGID
jgi:hypothetical protein